jgi:hypothetical protein
VDTMTRTEEAAAQRVRLMAGAGRAFDVIAVAALTVVAWLTRWGSLPSDGLWFDDSWVAAGAMLGSPGELLSVGSGHPGFTAILMAVDSLGGGDLAYLGVPSLVFGVLAAPALYLGLRSFGYGRAVSTILSAALAVAPIPILYSGRVKAYTLDTLLVLLLAVLIPALARRTWRWPIATAWTVTAVVVGTCSGYILLGTAVAGVILVLHPAGDRRMRMAAVGIQAVVQGAYLAVAQSKSDLAGIEEWMETAYDGHMSFSWNPLTFGREVLKHLHRLAEVFPLSPGDGRWWSALLAVLAMAGLVLGALKGRRQSETVAARFLLLLVVVAAGGSLVDRFPFGTSNPQPPYLFVRPLSMGGRHTLWLVPALAIGLGAVAHRARGLVAGSNPLRLGFDALAIVAAVVIVGAAYEPAPDAPFPGSESAAGFIDASVGPDDGVILTNTSTFSFAISTTTPIAVQETPHHQVGFAPRYLDRRIKNVGYWAATRVSPSQIRSWAADLDRVFVMWSGPVGGSHRERAGDVLVDGGFTLIGTRTFEWNTVDVYAHLAANRSVSPGRRVFGAHPDRQMGP